MSKSLHKPVRKRFPRNPCTVTNIDNVWEIDLTDFPCRDTMIIQTPFKCNRHIFALCLERPSKGQDRQVNRSGFNNLISK